MTVRHSVAIDSSGRLVIPKALRDELGLEPGRALEASARNGRLEIEPIPLDVELVAVDGVLVITPRESGPEMSRDDVRDVIESVRR